MGLYMVQNGMVAILFDNPGAGECSVMPDPTSVTEPSAMYTREILCHGLLCNEIKAIVFNEDLHDDRRRFMCITEHPGDRMFQLFL